MPDSQKQARLAGAIESGDTEGIKPFVREVLSKMRGKAETPKSESVKPHPLARLRGPELRPPKIVNAK